MPAVAAVAFEVIADVPLGNRNQLNALRAAVKDPNWPTRKFVTPDAGISACRTASGWIVGNSEVMRNGIAAYSRLVAQRLPMFSAHFECSARITAHSETGRIGLHAPQVPLWEIDSPKNRKVASTETFSVARGSTWSAPSGAGTLGNLR